MIKHLIQLVLNAITRAKSEMHIVGEE